jgi:hypothetical protein
MAEDLLDAWHKSPLSNERVNRIAMRLRRTGRVR